MHYFGEENRNDSSHVIIGEAITQDTLRNKMIEIILASGKRAEAMMADQVEFPPLLIVELPDEGIQLTSLNIQLSHDIRGGHQNLKAMSFCLYRREVEHFLVIIRSTDDTFVVLNDDSTHNLPPVEQTAYLAGREGPIAGARGEFRTRVILFEVETTRALTGCGNNPVPISTSMKDLLTESRGPPSKKKRTENEMSGMICEKDHNSHLKDNLICSFCGFKYEFNINKHKHEKVCSE